MEALTLTTSQNIHSVQLLRGLAVLAVVVFHCGTILGQTEFGQHYLFGGWTVYGKLGVNLFFMLSGFIILKAHSSDVGKPASFPRYAWRRFIRIFPIYWIILTANVAVSATGFGSPDFSWAPANLASAYALVPLTGEVSLPLKVAWSLFYEVRFYLIFGLAFVSARLALILATGWLVAILTAAPFGFVDPLELLSPWNLYFLAGMGICWVTEKLSSRWALPLLLAGGCALVAFALGAPGDAIQSDGVTATTYWFLPIFAAFVMGAVLLEPKLRLQRSPLLLLGDASYSIYLVHTSVISALAILAHRVGLTETAGGYGFFALTLLAAVAVGLAVFLVVERPVLKALRNMSSAGSRAPDLAPSRSH